MINKKPFYIKIVGAKIRTYPNRSKIPELDPVEIADQHFVDFNSAYAFADKTCRRLKQERNWHCCDITVVEHVPVKKAIYGLHWQQLKLIIDPFFRSNWTLIINNPLLIQAQSKLALNNYALLVNILCSFLRAHCQDFVSYEKDVRRSDLQSYQLALHSYLVEYYKNHPTSSGCVQHVSDPAEMGK